jgi:hypothetical protein
MQRHISNTSNGRKFGMKTGNAHTLDILLIVGSLLAVAEAPAQNASRFGTKGVFEVGGNISFQSAITVSDGQTDDNAWDTFNRTLYFGYFITDGFELGINPLSWRTISYGGQSISDFSFLVAPSYNFRTEGIIFPFVEGLLGYGFASNGNDRSGVIWGGMSASWSACFLEARLISLGAVEIV